MKNLFWFLSLLLIYSCGMGNERVRLGLDSTTSVPEFYYPNTPTTEDTTTEDSTTEDPTTEDISINYQTLFRLYKDGSGDHFYTTSESEKNAVIGDYQFEGSLGLVAEVGTAETLPFFRLFESQNGIHFYTTNVDEKNRLQGLGYIVEGVAGALFKESNFERLPVYRLLDSKTGHHLWTTSETEKNWLLGLGWSFEGIMGYVKKIL